MSSCFLLMLLGHTCRAQMKFNHSPVTFAEAGSVGSILYQTHELSDQQQLGQKYFMRILQDYMIISLFVVFIIFKLFDTCIYKYHCFPPKRHKQKQIISCSVRIRGLYDNKGEIDQECHRQVLYSFINYIYKIDVFLKNKYMNKIF